jgi:hypothetical protein
VSRNQEDDVDGRGAGDQSAGVRLSSTAHREHYRITACEVCGEPRIHSKVLEVLSVRRRSGGGVPDVCDEAEVPTL